MRRKAILVAAAFAVAFALGLSVGPTADALPPNCWLGCELNYRYTPTLTGHGIDCASAQADLNAQLNAAAVCDGPPLGIPLGFCEKTTVITQGCTCNGCCDYQYKGYMKYRCRWCIEV
jgi:hypothetical protein